MQRKEFCLKKRGNYYYRSWYDNQTPARRHWISTNCSSYIDAFNSCIKLVQEGRLSPQKEILFLDYALPFFNEDSLYMRDIMLRSSKQHIAMSFSYWQTCKQIVRNHLLPLFGNKSLKEITPNLIIEGRIKLSSEGKSNHTINNIVSVLSKILETAYQNDLITRNPCKAVKPLFEDENKRGTFQLDEAKIIFKFLWTDEESKTFNLVAALTGARLSEINASRAENLHENYIEVKDQFLKSELRPTKTQSSRIIPLCPEVHNLIQNNLKGNVFCNDLYESKPSNDLRNVLEQIMPDIRKEKLLSFHSWRHFFNTFLLSQGVAPIKVASVLEHSTRDVSQMTLRYCNFSVTDFAEIIKAQRHLYHLLRD